MARNGTTTRFGFDVTELQKGFQDAKTIIATANSELKTSLNDNKNTLKDLQSATSNTSMTQVSLLSI